MPGSDDGFISVHRETRERKRKSPRSGCASEALHQHYYAGESRVYSYTPIISRLSSIVKSRRDTSYMRPDMALRPGAVTTGAEAPRQRRAQRAEGKRLHGVAPVVPSRSATPEWAVNQSVISFGIAEYQKSLELGVYGSWRTSARLRRRYRARCDSQLLQTLHPPRDDSKCPYQRSRGHCNA
jgi:hypothetical protein